MTNEEFEQWYVENAFDYVSNPIGSRDCGLQRKAWNASREAVEGPLLARVAELEAGCTCTGMHYHTHGVCTTCKNPVINWKDAHETAVHDIEILKNTLESHGPEGHNATNQQMVDLREENMLLKEILQAENTRLREELAKPYDLRVSQLQYDLGNILACIHRDGGHYQIEHGTKKAATDAVAIICEWRNAFDELATEQGKSFTLGQCLDESRKELAAMREQEPVAWCHQDDLDNMLTDRSATIIGEQTGYYKTPLYAAPTAKPLRSTELKEPARPAFTNDGDSVKSETDAEFLTRIAKHGFVLMPIIPTVGVLQAIRKSTGKIASAIYCDILDAAVQDKDEYAERLKWACPPVQEITQDSQYISIDKAELAELRRDAERYQFADNQSGWSIARYIRGVGWCPVHPDELDAAIAAQRGEKSE